MKTIQRQIVLDANVKGNVIAFNGDSVKAHTRRDSDGSEFDYEEFENSLDSEFETLTDADKVAFFDNVIFANNETIYRTGSMRKMIQPSSTRQDALATWATSSQFPVAWALMALQSITANQSASGTSEDYEATKVQSKIDYDAALAEAKANHEAGIEAANGNAVLLPILEAAFANASTLAYNIFKATNDRCDKAIKQRDTRAKTLAAANAVRLVDGHKVTSDSVTGASSEDANPNHVDKPKTKVA